MNRIYLDFAATTPVDQRVFNAMRPYFSEKFGNPGSVHRMGQEAMAAVDVVREKIAKTIGAKFREVVFTASASEANNLVLRGIVKGIRNKESGIKSFKTIIHNPPLLIQRPRIIVSVIEHESILETAKDLEKDGVEVIYLPVNKNGLVNLKKLKTALNERTVLVSIMYASNEVGTIQPISEIAGIIADFKKTLVASGQSLYPIFHTDAVQALQYLNCDVNLLGVDMMTLSSHKIYGPKGAGALYIKGGNNESGIRNNAEVKTKYNFSPKPIIHNSPLLISLITGGGQEYGLRSGTENVPAIVGFGKAAELLASYPKEAGRVAELRNYFWAKLKRLKPKIEINGPAIFSDQRPAISDKVAAIRRLPNNLNVYFPDVSAEKVLIKLDMAGVEASAGSACAARTLTPSYVIKALGFSEKRAKSSIRFSLGRQTSIKDIDETIRRIKNLPS